MSHAVGGVGRGDNSEIVEVAGGDQQEELAGHYLEGFTAPQKRVHGRQHHRSVADRQSLPETVPNIIRRKRMCLD